MLAAYLKRGMNNTITYACASVITRGISFLFLPYFLSHLSLTEFGIWDFWQTFFSLGSLLLSSCAATAMTRFYLLYKDDAAKQAQSVGNMILLCLVGVIVFVLFLMCVPLSIYKVQGEALYLMMGTVCLF